MLSPVIQDGTVGEECVNAVGQDVHHAMAGDVMNASNALKGEHWLGASAASIAQEICTAPLKAALTATTSVLLAMVEEHIHALLVPGRDTKTNPQACATHAIQVATSVLGLDLTIAQHVPRVACSTQALAFLPSLSPSSLSRRDWRDDTFITFR